MNESMRRQDRAETIGFFFDGIHIGNVPPDDAYGDSTRAEVATRIGVNPSVVEVLKVCPDHPERSAVDCEAHEDPVDMPTAKTARDRFRVASLPLGRYEIRDYAVPAAGQEYTTGWGYGGHRAEEEARKDCFRLNSGDLEPNPCWYPASPDDDQFTDDDGDETRFDGPLIADMPRVEDLADWPY